MSLQGQIEEMGLAAVIQTLSLNRYHGTLRIETEDAGSQFFFISEGEIVLVRQVKRDPVRLGDLLLRAGQITDADLEQALAEQKKGAGKRLGQVLVDLGFTTQDEIEGVIRQKFEEEFLDLFLLDKGRFEFIFGLTPEALFAPDERLERVSLNSDALMFEAMRRVDEWQDMIRSLGSLDTIYDKDAKGSGGSVALEDFEPQKGSGPSVPARRRLVDLLDGTRSLREVLGQAIREGIASRAETFQFLHWLCETEQVRPLDSKHLLGAARTALGAKDVPRSAKYIRAILGRKGELEIPLIRRYLEFLRKNKRPKLAFDEAKVFAAQCLARDQIEQAIELYEEAIAIEVRGVEVIDRLFYALLRANRRERAIEVGLMLRESIGSDADLPVAGRIVRNLKELDPDNPEVLELSGLVLQRREQNEQAALELMQALQGLPDDHPRRKHVITALLQLQPEREDLRAEQESVEVREAREAMSREFRRRVLLAGVLPAGALVALVLVWVLYADSQAQGKVEGARGLLDGVPEEVAGWDEEDVAAAKDARDLLHEARAQAFFVPEGAAELYASVDERIKEKRDFDRERLDRLIRQRNAEAEEREAEEARRARERAFEGAVRAYELLVEQESFAEAARQAQEIAAEYGEDFGDRLPELHAFVRVETDPPGARVLVDGEVRGETPLVLSGPLGGALELVVRRRGYGEVAARVELDGYAVRELALAPGPSWRFDLGAAPVPPLGSWTGGVVAAAAGGRVVALDLDGRVLWEADAAAAAAGDAPVDWVRVLGGRVLVGRGGKVFGLDQADGSVVWIRALPGGRAPSLRATRVEVGGRVLAVVVRGETVAALDPRTGVPVGQTRLPGAAVQPPAAGGGRVFVALAGRQVVALQVAAGELPIAWRIGGVDAAGPPIYSRLGQAVVVPEAEELRTIVAEDGKILTTLRPDLGPLRSVAVAGERVWVLAESGLLAALRSYDGTLLVRGTHLGGDVAGGPVVVDEDVFLVDRAGILRRYSPSARERDTTIDLGGPVTAPLQGSEGRILAVVGETILLVEPPPAD